MTITNNSKLTFGKYRGKQLKNCPPHYLRWMANNLQDSDLYEWAQAAKTILQKAEERQIAEEAEKSLDEQANEFLRQRGVRVGKDGRLLS